MTMIMLMRMGSVSFPTVWLPWLVVAFWCGTVVASVVAND